MAKIKRTLYTFQETIEALGTDEESFRQALRYQIQQDEGQWIRACVDSRNEMYLAILDGELSQYPSADNSKQALDKEGNVVPKFGGDTYGSWEQCGTDQRTGYGAVYNLDGIFVVKPSCVRSIAEEAQPESAEEYEVLTQEMLLERGSEPLDSYGYKWPISRLLEVAPVFVTNDGQFPDVAFTIINPKGPDHLPIPKDARQLLFIAEDVDRFLEVDDVAKAESRKRQGTPLDTRERNSLLRVIRALDVMAGLPSRGATTAVENQVEQLGFNGPKDGTIRKILADARGLEPDKPQ